MPIFTRTLAVIDMDRELFKKAVLVGIGRTGVLSNNYNMSQLFDRISTKIHPYELCLSLEAEGLIIKVEDSIRQWNLTAEGKTALNKIEIPILVASLNEIDKTELLIELISRVENAS